MTDFAKDHWDIFVDEVDDKRDDGTGFKLEYDQCHKDFLRYFEDELEHFLQAEGSDLETFDKEARDVQQGKSLTLFENEDDDHQRFLEAILSSLDFEYFLKCMVQMAHNKTRKKNNKSKSKK